MSTEFQAIFGLLATPSFARTKTREPLTPPRTQWGDPELQGWFTNGIEVCTTPLERPKQFAGRRL
jgi:hypothetical protein